MIQFNTDLELLKKFVLEHGKISNWNYSENLLVSNILINEHQEDIYKIVRIRYYKGSGLYLYTDQYGQESFCDYITKWCSINI